MIKIALIDDHIVLRNSLAVLISMDTDFEIVMQASCGTEFIKQIRSRKNEIPDIVLLDITMPEMDGAETAQWLQIFYPAIRIIVLSMLHNEFTVIRMLRSGIRAYLAKTCEPVQLYDAIRSVYNNGYYYNEIVSPQVMNNKKEYLPQLSSQELVFIRWACTEKTYKEIAGEMQVRTRTIDNYRDALFEKLKVSSRVGIAMYAIRNKIVQI